MNNLLGEFSRPAGRVILAAPDHAEFIHSLTEATSVEEIHSTCSEISRWYGYDHFLYCARIPTSFVKPSIIIISGYPQEWRDHYTARKYMYIDPTVAHGATRNTPLSWQDVRAEDSRIRDFFGEAGEHGLRSGLSLPVHGSQGETGMLNLARAAACLPEDIHTPALHLISAYLHEAVRRIIEVCELPARPTLTRREIECLLWAAEGKTSWETAKILNISERTVVFHLQNTNAKLNVTNRQQAVARAVSMGLLGNEM